MDRSPGIVHLIPDKSQRKKSSSHLPLYNWQSNNNPISLATCVSMCVVLFWGKLVCCRLGLCLCVFPESSSSFSIILTHPGFQEGREERVGTHGTIEKRRQSSYVIPSLDNVLTPDKVDCFQFHSVNFLFFSLSSFFSL